MGRGSPPSLAVVSNRAQLKAKHEMQALNKGARLKPTEMQHDAKGAAAAAEGIAPSIVDALTDPAADEQARAQRRSMKAEGMKMTWWRQGAQEGPAVE